MLRRESPNGKSSQTEGVQPVVAIPLINQLSVGDSYSTMSEVIGTPGKQAELLARASNGPLQSRLPQFSAFTLGFTNQKCAAANVLRFIRALFVLGLRVLGCGGAGQSGDFSGHRTDRLRGLYQRAFAFLLLFCHSE